MKRKLSEKELMKRKFRKFLYDNDALEAWYKNIRLHPLNESIKSIFNKKEIDEWFSAAFYWGKTTEGMNYWVNLAMKWNAMNR